MTKAPLDREAPTSPEVFFATVMMAMFNIFILLIISVKSGYVLVSSWMQGVHRFGRLLPFCDEGMVRLNCKSDLRLLVDELQKRRHLQDFVERNEGKVNQITRGCLSVFVLYKESGIVEHSGTLAPLTSVSIVFLVLLTRRSS